MSIHRLSHRARISRSGIGPAIGTVAATVLISAALISAVLISALPKRGSLEQIQVADVVDGDTIVVRFGTRTETVRLLGINTPETVHPTKPEQCFGREAREALEALFTSQTTAPPTIKVERDHDARDAYDRLLLYVYLEDGTFINLWLIENGYANASIYEPNTTYAAVFTAAAHHAKRTGVGMWSSCGGDQVPLIQVGQ